AHLSVGVPRNTVDRTTGAQGLFDAGGWVDRQGIGVKPVADVVEFELGELDGQDEVRFGSRVALEPANSSSDPRSVSDDHLALEGHVSRHGPFNQRPYGCSFGYLAVQAHSDLKTGRQRAQSVIVRGNAEAGRLFRRCAGRSESDGALRPIQAAVR